MAVLVLPRSRRQPSGSFVLNRLHPLARSLRFFIATDGQGNFYEYVNGPVATKNGSAIAGMLQRGYGTSKVAKLTSAGSDFLSLANDTSHDIVGDLSLLWSGQLNSGSAFRSFVAKCTNNASTATPYDFRTDNSAAPLAILARASAGSSLQFSSSPLSIPLSKPATVGVSIAVANAFATFYINNIVLQQNPGSAITPTASATSLRVGRRPDGVVQMDGFTEFVMGWARVLSTAEFSALYDNPYQIVSLPARRVYFGVPSAASAAGTIAFTEAADTLAGVGANIVTAQLAFLDAVDSMALAATNTVQAAVALSESADSTAIVAKSISTATAALSEAADSLAAAAANITSAAIGGQEIADSMTVAAQNIVQAQGDLQEIADTLAGTSILAANIAFSEASDSFAFTAVNIVSVAALLGEIADTLGAVALSVAAASIGLQEAADALSIAGAGAAAKILLARLADRAKYTAALADSVSTESSIGDSGTGANLSERPGVYQ